MSLCYMPVEHQYCVETASLIKLDFLHTRSLDLSYTVFRTLPYF